MTRRDIIKGLVSVPILGLFFQQFFSKRQDYHQKRDQLLSELNISTDSPDIIPKTSIQKPGQLVRIGIIGFGNRGEYLARAIGFGHPKWIESLRKRKMDNPGDTSLQDWLDQENLNVAITGICDVFDQRRERGKIASRGEFRANKNYLSEAKTYRDYRAMLESKDIDAVIVATPDFHHAQITIDAVNAGKHIYCEKCMTRTEDEVYKVVDAVKNANVVFQLGHQYNQSSSYTKAKEIIDKKILGKINLIETTSNRNTSDGAWIRHLDKDGNPKPGDDKTIDWDLWLGSSPKVPFSSDRFYNWTKWWDYATGLSGQLLCHEYDTANQFLGLGIPKSAVASGGIYRYKDNREIPDVFHVVFEFPERDLTFIYSATLASSRYRGRVFMGHDGSMEIGNNVKVMIDANSTRFQDKISEGVIEPATPIISYTPGSKEIDAITSATEKYYAMRGLTYTYRGGERVNTSHLHLKEWLDCIRHGDTPSCSIDKGMEVTIACHMATKSYRENRRVEWNPDLKQIV
jgi:predicted dehydrogenase